MLSKLYFRADTRTPEVIFSEGFQPRTNSGFALNRPWWMRGLRRDSFLGYLPVLSEDFEGYSHSHTQAMDADSDYVISMSTEFETTPIFPIDSEQEVYVYIMALPEAKTPEHIGPGQQYDNIEVFDLHELQKRQVKDILHSHPQENPGYTAQALCGFEAFAPKVDASQIIAVVKCKRSDLLHQTAGAEVFPSNLHHALSFSRWFQVQNKLICNTDFKGDPKLVDQAIDKVRQVKAKGRQFTNNVEDGLLKSGIEYDPKHFIKTTYFWDNLTHYHFLNVLSSLLASIQYYFALVYHYLTSYEDSELLVEYMAKQAPTGVLPQFSIFTSKASFKEVPVERPAFELSAC